ncbi:uncharacterized protein [Hetaerina americana]|uniref:uncharacterized protein n=1 Tax=Hetaerina americana TaxID=62018 RepID=UPI003A7F33BF
MGSSLDPRRPGPSSLTPLSRGPDPAAFPRVPSAPLAHHHAPRRTRFLLFCVSFLVLEAVVGAASAGSAAAGGGRVAASAALFLTAFASTIDPSWQLTCYTCVNVTDNQGCNRYAIDRPCPEDKQFCHSLHVLEGFGSKGDSLLVNKGCAGEDECNPKSVGCRREGGQTTCNACCDYEYCNEKAPVDALTATLVQTKSSGMGSLVLTRSSALPFAVGLFACFILDGIRDSIAET